MAAVVLERNLGNFAAPDHGVETVDDGINLYLASLKDFRDPSAREWRAVFVELYFRGEVELLADLDVWIRGEHIEQVAIFRAHLKIKRNDIPCAARRRAYIDALGDAADWDYDRVFVGNVEIVNPAQYQVPAFVRFEPPNYVHDLWAGTAYKSLLYGCFKSRIAFRKGEIDALRLPSSQVNQGAGEVVERRSEVVDGIPDDKGDIDRQCLLLAEAQRIAAGLVVRFDNCAIRFSFQECEDLRVQVGDVAFGPIQL